MIALTKKPYVRHVRTREDILNEQKQAFFFKAYGIFFVSFILIVAGIRSHFADSIDKIHDEICDVSIESPLCRDFELLKRVDIIAKKKNVPTRLVIGIVHAESTLGTHFNKPVCASYHNWAGLKGRKFDDGHVEWYTAKKGKPDKNGCWLYKFDSIEQGMQSLVNTLAMGYKGCNNKTVCIAYNFVGHPDIAETSWIGRVEKFYTGV